MKIKINQLDEEVNEKNVKMQQFKTVLDVFMKYDHKVTWSDGEMSSYGGACGLWNLHGAVLYGDECFLCLLR